MDPSDLRAELAERLAGAGPIDAEAGHAACFMLARALQDIDFPVPEAAPLLRRVLRVAGRVVIDTGTPGADPNDWPDTQAMAVEWLDEGLRELGYAVRPVADSA